METKILRMGDPRLQQRCAEVTDESADELKEIGTCLSQELERLNATGIAAPQVGIMKRVIGFRLPESRIPEGCNTAPIELKIMLNPEIEVLDPQDILMWERCLSVPGMYGQVIRKRKIRVHFEHLDRTPDSIVLQGYPGAVVQHEVDHLNGVLYLERLSSQRMFGFSPEMIGSDGNYPYTPAEFDSGIALHA